MIGIIFASVIAAILIRFGYLFVAMTGLSEITKLAIALATFAGRLRGLFVTMGGMASTASAMATGLLLGGAAMSAGTGGGAVAGAAQADKAGLLRIKGALRGAELDWLQQPPSSQASSLAETLKGSFRLLPEPY